MTQRGNQDRGAHPSQGERSQVGSAARDNRDMESRQYGGVQGSRERQQRGTYGYDTSGIQDAQGGGLGYRGYQSRSGRAQQHYGSRQGGGLDNWRRNRSSASGSTEGINQSDCAGGSNQSETGGNRTGSATQSGLTVNGSGKDSSAASSKSK